MVQHRLDGGIDRGRRATFVFTVFRHQCASPGDKRIGPEFPGDPFGLLFVDIIFVGMKKMNDQGFHTIF